MCELIRGGGGWLVDDPIINIGYRFPNVLRYEVSDGKFQMVSFFSAPELPMYSFPYV